MEAAMVRPSRMSERRWNEGPDGLHQTMLDVSEMACFRLERFQKRHKLFVPEWPHQWSSEVDRVISSDSEETSCLALTFMDLLPSDVVRQSLWPVLMNGHTAHENFKTLCLIRCVCKAWMLYAEESKEWLIALEAWKKGDHRYLSDFDENPFLDTDSESDPDWGY
ncbi:hypothetical protein KC19_VG265900 [Ceratodon purpureus]|uniref:F-box domain-containing protein n=1 Tax=Ceratodon purpureus TaxID=3225 RepID=A0A8T0HTY5_CERPU|nr:hypothetical protein KC19_VG265900 [Ceratodon purpureus]